MVYYRGDHKVGTALLRGYFFIYLIPGTGKKTRKSFDAGKAFCWREKKVFLVLGGKKVNKDCEKGGKNI